MKKLTLVVLALLLTGELACKKSEPPPTPPPTTPPTTVAPVVGVTGVTLGNAIGADKHVTAPMEAFAVKDTIYASVDTAGTGHAKLRALWTFVKGDKTTKVNETTLEFDSSAPAVNEFHISKPGGWPKGDYKVEIFLGDAPTPAMTRTFKVS
jgi:CheY-specific phosphatase CheX